MKIRSKIIAVMLALSVVSSMMPATAFAAESTGIPTEEMQEDNQVRPTGMPGEDNHEKPTGMPGEDNQVRPTGMPGEDNHEKPTGMPGEDNHEKPRPTRVPGEDNHEKPKPTRVPEEDNHEKPRPTRVPGEVTTPDVPTEGGHEKPKPTKVPGEDNHEKPKPTRVPGEVTTPDVPTEGGHEKPRPTRVPEEVTTPDVPTEDGHEKPRPTDKPATESEEEAKPVKPSDKRHNVKKIKVKVTSKGSSSIEIKWEKVKDADYCEVYRAASKNGKYKKIKTIYSENITAYINSRLKCGKKYYYIVKYYKKNGDDKTCVGNSTVSSAVAVPAKPSFISVKEQENKVTLKWKKVKDSSGYEVYRATSKNGKYKKVKTVKGSSKNTYTNGNLKSDIKYYYKIRTYKKVNGKKVYGTYSKVKTVKAD